MRRCHAVKAGKPVLMCHIVEGHEGKHIDLEFGREWEEPVPVTPRTSNLPG